MKFELSKIEEELSKKFIEKHIKECKPEKMDCTGARWKFSFIPTGFGVNNEIECIYCNKSENINDPEDFENF